MNPEQVERMAHEANGTVARWREENGQYVVLLTDGRKLYAPIEKEAPPPKHPTPHQYKDGENHAGVAVGAEEPTRAPRTKKEKKHGRH